MTDIQPRRRRFLTYPGESLLVPLNAADFVARFPEFEEITGLDTTDIYLPSITSIPLPMYKDGYGKNHNRLPNVRTDFMWHPFVWLPADIVGRYSITQADGEPPIVEPDDVWALRMGLLMQNTGLYDIATGEWLDVLSVFGLDIDDPEVRERIDAWREGADDEILDSIESDIGQTIMDSHEDSEWAITAAMAMAPDVVVSTWHTLGIYLKRNFDALTSSLLDGTAESLSDVAEDLLGVAYLAQACLSTIPVKLMETGSIDATDDGPTSEEYWGSIVTGLSSDDPATSIDALDSALSTIIEFSRPFFDALNDLDNDILESRLRDEANAESEGA